VAALFLSRLISSMLWGVSPTDPATVVAVALILTGSAALASYIPARAAAAGDPRVALE
jgi:ABC-type lipoprotein release transport system permease subunit